MIIHCVELGSHYWPETRYEADGDYARSRSCYFNSTGFPRRGTSVGVPVNWEASRKSMLRCWSVPGVVRFNAAGFPRAAMPADLNGVSALTNGIEMWNGQKRLLLRRAVGSSEYVDAYLVAVRSATQGRIDFRSNWRTSGVRLVCASSNKGRQETLILMPPNGIITTEFGSWQIQWRRSAVSRKRAFLELVEDVNAERESRGPQWQTISR